MPGGFGEYVDSLGIVLEMASRTGATPSRLQARVKARFDKNERWLRNIVSFLVNVGLLRQDGDRIRAPQANPSPERVIRTLHGSIKFIGEMLAEIERNPLTNDGVAEVAQRGYGLGLGDSRVNDRRGWLESAGMITATGRPRTLTLTRKGMMFLGKLEQEGLLVTPIDRASTPARKRNTRQGTGKLPLVIPPNDENLKSNRATAPLTAWLIHAAKSRGTMTYGQAKRRLESECGFGDIFTVRIGKVAGVAMNRILEQAPRAPMLNVLLVQAATRLPGSGVAGYLAIRDPGQALAWAEGCAPARELAKRGRGRGAAGVRISPVGRSVPAGLRPSSAGASRRAGATGQGEGRHAGNRRRGSEPPCVEAGRCGRTPASCGKDCRPRGRKRSWSCCRATASTWWHTRPPRTVAIEVKSRDSDWADLQRGVYQCVKYRAVLEAQDIRRRSVVESWLVTEIPLPSDLRALARLLNVRTKVLG